MERLHILRQDDLTEVVRSRFDPLGDIRTSYINPCAAKSAIEPDE